MRGRKRNRAHLVFFFQRPDERKEEKKNASLSLSFVLFFFEQKEEATKHSYRLELADAVPRQVEPRVPGAAGDAPDGDGGIAVVAGDAGVVRPSGPGASGAGLADRVGERRGLAHESRELVEHFSLFSLPLSLSFEREREKREKKEKGEKWREKMSHTGIYIFFFAVTVFFLTTTKKKKQSIQSSVFPFFFDKAP